MATEKNKVRDTKKYYTSSSQALKTNQIPEEVFYPKKRKKVKKVLKKIKIATKYKYLFDKKSKLSFLTYLTIIVVFVGAVINLSLDAKKNYLALKIDSLHTVLNTLEEENQELSLNVSDGYDLVEIEKIVKTRLGMSRPQDHQIINIEIDRSNFANHGEIEFMADDFKSSKVSIFKDFFNKILKKK